MNKGGDVEDREDRCVGPDLNLYASFCINMMLFV